MKSVDRREQLRGCRSSSVDSGSLDVWLVNYSFILENAEHMSASMVNTSKGFSLCQQLLTARAQRSCTFRRTLISFFLFFLFLYFVSPVVITMREVQSLKKKGYNPCRGDPRRVVVIDESRREAPTQISAQEQQRPIGCFHSLLRTWCVHCAFFHHSVTSLHFKSQHVSNPKYSVIIND